MLKAISIHSSSKIFWALNVSFLFWLIISPILSRKNDKFWGFLYSLPREDDVWYFLVWFILPLLIELILSSLAVTWLLVSESLLIFLFSELSFNFKSVCMLLFLVEFLLSFTKKNVMY